MSSTKVFDISCLLRNRAHAYLSLSEHLIPFSPIIIYVDVYFHKEMLVKMETTTTFSLYNAFIDNQNLYHLFSTASCFLHFCSVYFLYLSTFFMFTECSFQPLPGTWRRTL